MATSDDRRSHRRSRLLSGVTLFAVSCFGCGDLEFARVSLPLAVPPADVATVSLRVVDRSRGRIVASATVGADRTSFELGLPAEVPLEFTVVARSDRPAPAPYPGRLPKYVGRTVRTIPLSRELQIVPIELHPAGILTLAATFSDHVHDDSVVVELESVSSAHPRVVFSLERSGPSFTVSRSEIVRAGKWNATIAASSPSRHARAIAGGRGIFVAHEAESLAVVHIREKHAPLPDEAPHALSLSLVDESGAIIEPPDEIVTLPLETRHLRLDVRAIDARRREVAVPNAKIDLEITSDPIGVLGAATMHFMGLPLEVDAIDAQGVGRAVLTVTAHVGRDALPLVADRFVSLFGSGIAPGSAASLGLRVLDPSDLVFGSRLAIEVLDANGLHAHTAAGRVDLSSSDPHLVFDAEPIIVLGANDRGHITRIVARPSAPRDQPRVLRATFTSTTLAAPIDATLEIPPLELPR